MMMSPMSLMSASRFIGQIYPNSTGKTIDFDTVGSSTLVVVDDEDGGDDLSPQNSNSTTNRLGLLLAKSSPPRRIINLMDFFDFRKFQTSRDFVFTDGRLQAVSDYSLIALLPIILVAFLVTAIFFVYRFRRWKHNRKQLAELDAFYEIVESSPCLSGKPHLMKHAKDHEKSDCDQITRAVTVPSTGGSMFFQPIPPKTTSVRCTAGKVMKAANASDVIYHFAHLPNLEKSNKKSSTGSTSLVHRV